MDSTRPGGRRIVLNIFSNWTRYGVVLAIGFLITPFIWHTLGKEQYGIWSMLVSTVSTLTLLDLGVNQATVKYVSERTGSADPEGVAAVFNVSLRFFALVAALVLVAAALGAPLLYALFPAGRVGQGWDPLVTSLTLFLLCSDMAAVFLFAVYTAVLFGKQRYELANAAILLALFAKTALTVWLLQKESGILILGLLNLIQTLLKAALMIAFVRSQFPEIRIQFGPRDRALFRKVAQYSAFAFILAVSSKIVYFSPPLVLGFLGSLGEVAIYSIPLQIYMILAEIVWSIAMVYVPLVSSLQGRNQDETIRHLVLKGSRYCLLVATPILFFVVVFGREFLYTWMHWRPKEIENREGYLVLLLLAAGALLQAAGQVSVAALIGMARHRVLAAIFGGEAILNVGLSVALVPRYGIAGLALGGAIPPLISNGLLLPLYASRTLGIRIPDFLRRAALPAWLAAGPAMIVSFFLAKDLIPIVGRATLLLNAALVGGLFALSSILLGIPAEDRRPVLAWLKRRLGLAGGAAAGR